MAHYSTSWNSMVLLRGAVPRIVELLHNSWSNGPLSATVLHFRDTVPQIVELFHKKWNFHFVSVFLDTIPLCWMLYCYSRCCTLVGKVPCYVFGLVLLIISQLFVAGVMPTKNWLMSNSIWTTSPISDVMLGLIWGNWLE